MLLGEAPGMPLDQTAGSDGRYLKATHGYYSAPHWRRLRSAALTRDGYRFTVAGSGRRATRTTSRHAPAATQTLAR